MHQCDYCKRVLPDYTLISNTFLDATAGHHVTSHRCRDTKHCRLVMQVDEQAKVRGVVKGNTKPLDQRLPGFIHGCIKSPLGR